MDEIFSKKAWCAPVALASSSGLSKKQDDEGGSVGQWVYSWLVPSLMSVAFS